MRYGRMPPRAVPCHNVLHPLGRERPADAIGICYTRPLRSPKGACRNACNACARATCPSPNGRQRALAPARPAIHFSRLCGQPAPPDAPGRRPCCCSYTIMLSFETGSFESSTGPRQGPLSDSRIISPAMLSACVMRRPNLLMTRHGIVTMQALPATA